MTRGALTKRVIQAVAAAFGVLGVMWILLGFDAGAASVGEADRFSLFYTILPAILFGGIAVAIAWLNLRHFGPRSIRHITALVVVSVYLCSMPLVEPLAEAATDARMDLFFLAVDLLLLVLMYWLYRAVSRKLIQLTDMGNSREADPTLLSNAASDASSERE
jgi:hypothetical protein